MRTERRKLMAGEMLPVGYQRLEYISNKSKHAYIEITSLAIDNTTKWYFDYALSSGNNIFKANFSYWISLNNFVMINITDSNFLLKSEINVPYNKRTRAEIDLQNRIYTQIIDGKTYTAKLANTSLLDTNRFTFMYINGMYNPFGKIYGIKVMNSGNIIFHAVPAKRKSDGAIGMLDIVDVRFYTSPNGVAFTGGVKFRTILTAFLEPAVTERRAA